MRQEEMESFFKKASLEYFNKLRDVQSSVDKMRGDQMAQNNIVSKVNILESEIIDLKNKQKSRISKMDYSSLGMDPEIDELGGIRKAPVNERIDLVIDEVNQTWSFIQRYIDEQGIDMIQDVKSADNSYKLKMDRMDWLARHSEYISPDQVTKCLLAFKDLFNGVSLP